MAETNGEVLMREMNTYLNEAVSAQSDADTALPFESISDYLGDPNGFADVTAKLWKKVSTVFDLAVKFNRHSSDYLKSCAQLEKGIKFLGSSCLQKYALEQKKHVFPELGQLNTANLYTMASIHFNNIDRALSEYIDQKQSVDDALLDMEYRYYHLMERIRATEVKIHNYNNKRYSGDEDYNPVIHGLAFSDKSWTKSQHEHDEPMAFQRARAFSAKSEIRNQKPEIGGQDSDAGSQVSGVSEQDAAVSSQLPVASGQNTGVSEQLAVVSGQQSEIDENQDAAENSSTPENREMVREQFSKDPEVHVVCPDDAAKPAQQDCTLAAAADIEADEICSDADTQPVQQCSDSALNFMDEDRSLQDMDLRGSAAAEPPQCVQIIQQVVMRSRIQGLDYLGFTEREMRLLAADPMFDMIDPVMAADLRKALAEHDSG